MKNTLICPKCDGNRIFYIDRIADATDSMLQPMRIGADGRWNVEKAGELSATVCRVCGYTEFYVKEPALIVPDGDLVRELVGPSRPGPYRD